MQGRDRYIVMFIYFAPSTKFIYMKRISFEMPKFECSKWGFSKTVPVRQFSSRANVCLLFVCNVTFFPPFSRVDICVHRNLTIMTY